MSIEIKTMSSSEIAAWDTYVNVHPQATLYHLSGWKNVIEKSYGHKTYYLMAVNSSQHTDDNSKLIAQSSKEQSRPNYEPSAKSYDLGCEAAPEPSANSYELDSNRVVGILPLVHLRHFIFGNSLISIPFFDIGGILADDVEIEKLITLPTHLGINESLAKKIAYRVTTAYKLIN